MMWRSRQFTNPRICIEISCAMVEDLVVASIYGGFRVLFFDGSLQNRSNNFSTDNILSSSYFNGRNHAMFMPHLMLVLWFF